MVQFMATLKTSGKCIKIDDELEAEITLTVPRSEISELIKMAMFAGKRFKVVIMEVKEDEKIHT